MGILFIFRYCKNAQNQIFQHSNERKCILAEFRFWNERLEDERWWRHWSDPCPGPTAESVQRGSPVEIDHLPGQRNRRKNDSIVEGKSFVKTRARAHLCKCFTTTTLPPSSSFVENAQNVIFKNASGNRSLGTWLIVFQAYLGIGSPN